MGAAVGVPTGLGVGAAVGVPDGAVVGAAVGEVVGAGVVGAAVVGDVVGTPVGASVVHVPRREYEEKPERPGGAQHVSVVEVEMRQAPKPIEKPMHCAVERHSLAQASGSDVLRAKVAPGHRVAPTRGLKNDRPLAVGVLVGLGVGARVGDGMGCPVGVVVGATVGESVGQALRT